MAAITRDGYVIGASPSNAEDVNYDNSTSGLEADDVQEAIDEVSTTVDAIKDGTDIDSFSDVESAISTLQSNFQDGVDDIYDAVVAKGTTPASKSLSDVVQGIADIETATVHTETYTASSRASNLDMGESHEYRYVDTNSVPNSNSGTYTYPSGSTGGTVDMLADNTYRYVNADNVYTKGNSDGIAATKIGTAAVGDVLAGKTFTNSSSVGANGSMVNLSTNSRYQHASNNATPTLIGDAGYFTTVYDNVSKSNLGDYFEIRYNGSKNKNNNIMTNGYMQTNTLLALPSQTKSVTAGTSATTVSPDSNKVLKSVTVNPTPSQEKSITSSRSAQTVTPDSGKLLSKVTVAKYPDASGTYTASSRGSALDMGATNNLRYVNTNGVPNSNSGTYTYGSGSTGGTVDLGATNTYRYVNAGNVYSKGVSDADGRSNPSSYNYQTGYNAGYSAGSAGKHDISVATIIESTTWTSDGERASKVSFSATSGYVYAIAWGGDAGWAGTPSCSGGSILGWTNKTHSVSGRTSGCGLFIVQATSGTVTLTATGSWPYNGLATVIRVTT